MRQLEGAIQKNIELSEEFELNHSYRKAVWKFYTAHAIALSIIGCDEPQARKKNKIWKKFLLGKEGVDSKSYGAIKRLFAEDQQKIGRAMRLIQEQKEASGGFFGGFYKPGTVAILAYEYPQEE